MVFLSRENFIDLVKKLPLGGTISLEPHDCSLILERSALNVILSEDSFIKTLFIGNVVNFSLKEGSVVYIDLDTILSAFLNLIIYNAEDLDNLLILRSNGEDVEKIMAYACSLFSPYIKLIVIDSVTTLYYLLNSKAPSDVNRKIGVYLSLLQSLANKLNIPVIVTSMIRAKKVKQAKSWFTSPTGGRALLRSKIVLKLNKIFEYIEINIIKHENDAFIGKTIKIPIKLSWSEN
jgi:RecA/RadA recombinase